MHPMDPTPANSLIPNRRVKIDPKEDGVVVYFGEGNGPGRQASYFYQLKPGETLKFVNPEGLAWFSYTRLHDQRLESTPLLLPDSSSSSGGREVAPKNKPWYGAHRAGARRDQRY